MVAIRSKNSRRTWSGASERYTSRSAVSFGGSRLSCAVNSYLQYGQICKLSCTYAKHARQSLYGLLDDLRPTTLESDQMRSSCGGPCRSQLPAWSRMSGGTHMGVGSLELSS